MPSTQRWKGSFGHRVALGAGSGSHGSSDLDWLRSLLGKEGPSPLEAYERIRTLVSSCVRRMSFVPRLGGQLQGGSNAPGLRTDVIEELTRDYFIRLVDNPQRLGKAVFKTESGIRADIYRFLWEPPGSSLGDRRNPLKEHLATKVRSLLNTSQQFERVDAYYYGLHGMDAAARLRAEDRDRVLAALPPLRSSLIEQRPGQLPPVAGRDDLGAHLVSVLRVASRPCRLTDLINFSWAALDPAPATMQYHTPLALEELRRTGSGVTTPEASELPDPHALSPFDLIALADLEQTATTILRALPERTARVAALRHVAGLDTRETAAQLTISKSTAHNEDHAFRAAVRTSARKLKLDGSSLAALIAVLLRVLDETFLSSTSTRP